MPTFSLLRRAFLGCLFGLALVGESTMAAEPSPAPLTLKAFIDRFPGPSYIIELRGSTVHYEEYRRKPGSLEHAGSTYAKVTPTAGQWKEFRSALDSLKVWSWRPEYNDYSTADGIMWRFEVVYAGRRLKTEGSNNYPNESGGPSRGENQSPPDLRPSPTFEQLLTAIQKLLGDYKFTWQRTPPPTP